MFFHAKISFGFGEKMMMVDKSTFRVSMESWFCPIQREVQVHFKPTSQFSALFPLKPSHAVQSTFWQNIKELNSFWLKNSTCWSTAQKVRVTLKARKILRFFFLCKNLGLPPFVCMGVNKKCANIGKSSRFCCSSLFALSSSEYMA